MIRLSTVRPTAAAQGSQPDPPQARPPVSAVTPRTASGGSRPPRIPGSAVLRQALLRTGVGGAGTRKPPCNCLVGRPWTAPT